jgi:hypothetical protein
MADSQTTDDECSICGVPGGAVCFCGYRAPAQAIDNPPTGLREGQHVLFFRNAIYGFIMRGPERCAGSDNMYLVQTGVGQAEWVHRDSLRIAIHGR